MMHAARVDIIVADDDAQSAVVARLIVCQRWRCVPQQCADKVTTGQRSEAKMIEKRGAAGGAVKMRDGVRRARGEAPPACLPARPPPMTVIDYAPPVAHV